MDDEVSFGCGCDWELHVWDADAGVFQGVYHEGVDDDGTGIQL